jgi:hypothetical protein
MSRHGNILNGMAPITGTKGTLLEPDDRHLDMRLLSMIFVLMQNSMTCTPHAARRTPHAARRTPHAARRTPRAARR